MVLHRDLQRNLIEAGCVGCELYYCKNNVIALIGLSRNKAISHLLIHVTATQKEIHEWQRGGGRVG